MIDELLPSRSAAPRILLIEDDRIAAQAARDQLERVWPDGEVRHVTSIEEALPLAVRGWDVALLDLGLPGCTGLQALHRLAAAAPHVPIVVLTAQDEEELALGALRQEAQDYLSKRNVDAYHLARSIRYAVERHRNLSRLRASERSLLNLVDAHTDGVLVVDEQGDVVYANAAARELLRERDLSGRSISELPIEEGASGLRLDAPGGETRIVDVVVTATDWRGEPAKMVVLHDVTERHQAEQLRLQMQHNERMAAIGTLSAGIAHEINNPLTYVLGCLEVLRRDLTKRERARKRAQSAAEAAESAVASSDAAEASQGGRDESVVSPEGPGDSARAERARGLVDRAVDGVERVVAIVRNLGKFSRSDDEFQIEPTLLVSVLRTAIETTSPQLRHRARVLVDVDDELCVLANAGPLTQVFVNLLVNAAHAIDEGNVDANSVSIRAEKRGDDVFVSVRDTGVGIPEAQLSRLFDPFFTTKSAGEGTGLGLHVCRSIVESFGGAIQVQSRPGEGTTFQVRLVVFGDARPAETATRDSVPPSRGPYSIKRRLDGARVLVVDDEEYIRQSIEMALPATCHVTLAESSKAAIAKLQNDAPFDLILCDVVMDDGSGLELRDWIVEFRPDLSSRLLFMSGGTLRHASPAEGGYEVINKPFRQEELLSRISSALPSIVPPPLG